MIKALTLLTDSFNQKATKKNPTLPRYAAMKHVLVCYSTDCGITDWNTLLCVSVCVYKQQQSSNSRRLEWRVSGSCQSGRPFIDSEPHPSAGWNQMTSRAARVSVAAGLCGHRENYACVEFFGPHFAHYYITEENGKYVRESIY